MSLARIWGGEDTVSHHRPLEPQTKGLGCISDLYISITIWDFCVGSFTAEWNRALRINQNVYLCYKNIILRLVWQNAGSSLSDTKCGKQHRTKKSELLEKKLTKKHFPSRWELIKHNPKHKTYKEGHQSLRINLGSGDL